jgi:hypothetical protein
MAVSLLGLAGLGYSLQSDSSDLASLR